MAEFYPCARATCSRRPPAVASWHVRVDVPVDDAPGFVDLQVWRSDRDPEES
jgi:hypothetical protein